MTAHKVALIEFYAFNFGAIMGPNVGALKFPHTHTYTHTHTQWETIHTHTHKETDISTWQAQKPIKLICQTLKRRLSTFMFTNPWHICANGYIPDSVCVCVCVCVCDVLVCASVRPCELPLSRFFVWLTGRAKGAHRECAKRIKSNEMRRSTEGKSCKRTERSHGSPAVRNHICSAPGKMIYQMVLVCE